ncbi:hypothetical protein GCM10007276_07070 [Agaricicola taiwanensis]|uniref:Uncharacterized protein n=1 Tax=Agaricicola taiwanensis TaxID=591372 RepID=A0A8J2YFH7_9RHOB|nr:hypothetical protein [Agaricicola taiwanensis]GGE32391.1 hypothetical protein GCM10007276_07070 [Agaricicola taiwanensis]
MKANLAKSMQARMPFQIAQKILRQLDLDRGMGWEKTVQKIASDDLTDEQVSSLEAALREHIFCGEKSVRFFHISDDERSLCQSSQFLEPIPESEFRKHYPASVPEDQLAGLPNKPILTAIETVGEDTAFVFCSVRTQTIREPIRPDQLPTETASDLFQSYEEIVGLKTKRIQAFDVIWIPGKSKLADARVDQPLGMLGEAAENAHIDLAEAFNKLVGQNIFSNPINLFPLIEKMYGDEKEGVVVELGFGTSTASVKQEKMRRQGACLRKESYHVGGKANLPTPIEPYRVSIMWKLPLRHDQFSTPELSLNSSVRIAGSAMPSMLSVNLRKCLGNSDYNFVRSRIASHLYGSPTAAKPNP